MTEFTPIPPMTLRQFEQLKWVDPKPFLVNMRNLELGLPEDLDERTRRLRTNNLKEWREARVAALFAYGIASAVLRRDVQVSKAEAADYDCVMR